MEAPTMENYVKWGGSYINKNIVPSNQIYVKAARNITKIRIGSNIHLEDHIKDSQYKD